MEDDEEGERKRQRVSERERGRGGERYNGSRPNKRAEDASERKN